MAKGTYIDLTARFKTKRSRSGSRNKFYMEIKAPSIKCNLEGRDLLAPVALAIQNELKAALLAGRRLDGSPMPAPKPATVKRREYRDKQRSRGTMVTKVSRRKPKGVREWMKAHDPNWRGKSARSGGTKWTRFAILRESSGRGWKTRGKAEKRRRDAERNYDRRFRAAALGQFDPRDHGNSHPIGVESGMLAESIRCHPDSAGQGWAMYFTDRRTFIDKKGQSPVTRVFGSHSDILKVGALNRNATIRQAMDMSLGIMAGRRRGEMAKSFGKLMREVSKLARTLGQGQAQLEGVLGDM